MGGKGSGGRRPGAKVGRPRKARDLEDPADQARGRVLNHPSAPPAVPVAAPVELDEADAPNELSFDERRVWLRLAPDAMQNGTLTPDKATAFIALCRMVCREQELAASVLDRCSTKHIAVFREMNKGLDAFRLRPDGRPAAAEPASAAPKKAAYW